MTILKKLWPLLLGLGMFIIISYLVQQHLGTLKPYLTSGSLAYGMSLYVLLGIATAIIPFGSLTPFVPLAVSLWGWPITAGLTLFAWVSGSQLLFEFSRAVGKPVILKYMPKTQLETIGRLVEGKSLAHSIFIRMFTHGDIISYAFGIFTNVNRWEFLIITAIAIAPGALSAAYFGSLPIVYQISLGIFGITVLAAYFTVQAKNPEWIPNLLRAIGLKKVAKAEKELEAIGSIGVSE